MVLYATEEVTSYLDVLVLTVLHSLTLETEIFEVASCLFTSAYSLRSYPTCTKKMRHFVTACLQTKQQTSYFEVSAQKSDKNSSCLCDFFVSFVPWVYQSTWTFCVPTSNLEHSTFDISCAVPMPYPGLPDFHFIYSFSPSSHMYDTGFTLKEAEYLFLTKSVMSYLKNLT
jgi:hypothetical protein